MDKREPDGLLGIEYAKERRDRPSFRYRLSRRTREVLSAIEEYAPKPVMSVIDLGTADGRMLQSIYRVYPQARCVGVEYSRELANLAKKEFPHLEIIQADVRSLGIQGGSFDVAIATAIIEHLPRPEAMLVETKRVLRPGGVLIMTSPDPFWERLAGYVGHLKREGHQNVMNIKQLIAATQKSGLSILDAKKFMLSPVGMPFEISIENIIRGCGMSFLMANQLVIAQA